jgi:chaperone required for assembly of F1-ATPase
MSSDQEKFEAMKAGVLKLKAEHEERKSEIIGTICTHHGMHFGMAALAAVELQHSVVAITTVANLAPVPRELQHATYETLAGGIGSAIGALLLLAARLTLPDASERRRLEEANKVRKLMEPVIDDYFACIRSSSVLASQILGGEQNGR